MAGSISPKLSFHLCPDFSISPPPNGHLQLGSVLAGLDIENILDPLDGGATVAVNEAQLFPRDKPQEKIGFCRSMRDLRGLEGSIWAKIFGWEGLGAAFSFFRSRENDETLTVEKLLVRYFIPTPEYTEQVLAIDGVAFYVNETDYKEPIYIVIGLMWVEGAKLSKLQSRKNGTGGKVAATPGGGNLEGDGGNSLILSFDGSNPFVLGIRVRKIWWDKKDVRHESLHAVGATLGDSKRNDSDVMNGLQYVDDEEFDASTGKTVLDETQFGEEFPVIWVLP